jgi:hypothetical protein
MVYQSLIFTLTFEILISPGGMGDVVSQRRYKAWGLEIGVLTLCVSVCGVGHAC